MDEHVLAFAKNAGLGFAIPYFHNGQIHDYVPDFLVRLGQSGREVGTLILEAKGYDPLKEIKQAAAARWVAAVNADGRRGRWAYHMIERVADLQEAVCTAAVELATGASDAPSVPPKVAASPTADRR